jgi:carbonic anhydrase
MINALSSPAPVAIIVNSMLWSTLLPLLLALSSAQSDSRYLQTSVPNYLQSGLDWGGKCLLGLAQSPLDLTVVSLQFEEDNLFSAITPNYNSFSASYGFTARDYRIWGSFGQLRLQSVTSASTEIYASEYISFHAPSEHKINGHQFALEMQIRHSFLSAPQTLNSNPANSSYAIISVLFDIGAESDFLSEVLVNAAELDLMDVFPEGIMSDYFLYEGSETLSPCEERVNWAVWGKAQQLSADQLTFFRSKWQDSLEFAKGNGNNREVVGTSEGRTVRRVLK